MKICEADKLVEGVKHPPVWDLVVLDMMRRDRAGMVKYSTPLVGHNGKNALLEAYEEALDLVVYLRQALYEKEGK